MSDQEKELYELVKEKLERLKQAEKMLKAVTNIFVDEDDTCLNQDEVIDPYRIKYEQERLISEINKFLGDK